MKQHSMIVGEMADQKDKPFLLYGSLGGEMSVNDVPLAQGIDMDTLKKDDQDPLEVVVEIPASKSKRGWYYTGESLKNIVDHVNENTLNGFLGHQSPEDVPNQFPTPVTHWVGAKMEGETAYFRGLVDKSADDLKRWVRTQRVKQVSIYGMPKLEKSGSQTNVVGYKPLSIDWTPLDRAGMDTKIVAAGEMWDVDGQGPNQNKGGNEPMNPEELLKELGKMAKNKQITVPMVAGEMGLTAESAAGEIDSNWAEKVKKDQETLHSVNKALGVTGEMDPVQEAKKAADAVKKQETAEFDKSIGEMMDSKLQSEPVKKAIQDDKTQLGKLWSYHRKGITSDMDKQAISGEIDNFLADDIVKGLVSNTHTDQPTTVTPTVTGNQNTRQNVNVKKQTI